MSEVDSVFYLWPENVPALALFNAVSTQWRTDFGHRTGLDYAGVRAAPAFLRIKRRKRESVLTDVCTIERAWLDARDKHAAEKKLLDDSLPPKDISG